MQALILPRVLLRRLLGRWRHTPDHTVWGRVGVYHHGGDTTWLLRDLIEMPHAAFQHALLWHFQLLSHPPRGI